MAYYDYYRQRNPSTWGRPDSIMDSPPAPGYQPQPQWRGSDYYRAHYGNSYDPSLFDSVLGRMRSHFQSPISRRDAENLHQRVYRGLVDVATMMPAEIGAAAGYEAWRFWEHHRGIYRQPLMDDHDREREALIGLAAGEAEKLWDYTRRYGDKLGKREALEVAAAVAMKLFRKGGGGGGYQHHSSVRYEQPFMSDSRYPRHHRHHHHHRGSSDGYSSGPDSSEFDYGRSPAMTSAYSPSIAGGIPIPGGIPIAPPMSVAGSSYGGDGYHRRRSASFYGQRPQQFGTSPYIAESALSTSPNIGPLIVPPMGHHHSSSFGGYSGNAYEYRDHNGVKVHRTIHGDPNSEYGHLPPGTYMVQGGSNGHHRRRRKSVGRYLL